LPIRARRSETAPPVCVATNDIPFTGHMQYRIRVIPLVDSGQIAAVQRLFDVATDDSLVLF
jgi:hypothetical protein